MDTLLFIIRWLPTIIFISAIILPSIAGTIRGYRKSAILFKNSVILSVIFIILYLIIVNTNFGDKLLLNIADLIFGGKGSFKNYINVDSSSESFREVLVKYLSLSTNTFTSVAGLASLIEGNGIYVETIVSFIYHIVFALLFYILYLVFDFILYLIYLIFRNEFFHARKINRKFSDNQEFSTYRHNTLGGFFIGLSRGVIRAFILITFLGSTYFVLSGDNGTGKMKDMEIENKDVSFAYRAYQEIDSYSNYGIFKVLNTFKDNNGTPVYLEIPDLILSGSVTKNNTTKEFNLRKDLATYTSLAKSLIISISESKKDVIEGFFNGEVTASEVVSEAYTLASDPLFQTNLVSLIKNIPEDNFTIDLTMNVSNTLFNYIDVSTLGVGDDVIDPLCILFKDGYLSDTISEEVLIKEYNETVSTPITFKTIKASDIINKDDLLTIINLAFVVVPQVKSDTFNASDISGSIVPLVNSTLDEVKKLTIFKENQGMNECIGRIYKYAEVKFLNGDSTETTDTDNNPNVQTVSKKNVSFTQTDIDTINSYVNDVKKGFDWFTEVNSLFDLFDDVADLYTVYESIESDNVLVKILEVLKANESKETINKIFNYLETSKIIGETLESKFVTATLESSIKSIVGNESYTLPSDMHFINTYDESGNIKETGELSNIFGLMNILLSNEDLFNTVLSMFGASSSDKTDTDTNPTSILLMNKSFIDGDTDEPSGDDEEENSDNNITKILNLIINVLEIEYNNKNIVDYVVDSSLLRSITSELLISKLENMITVPKSAREYKDGSYLNMIKKDELRLLFDSLSYSVEETVDRIVDDMKNDDAHEYTDEEIQDYLYSLDYETFYEIKHNYELSDINVIMGIINTGVIDFNAILNLNLFNKLLNSKIIQATVGAKVGAIENEFLIIPEKYKDPENWATDGSNKSELIKIFDSIKMLELDIASLMSGSVTDDTYMEIIGKIFEFTDSEYETFFASSIIHYSLSNILDNKINELLGNDLTITIPKSAAIYLNNDSLERVIKVEQFKHLFRGIASLGATDLSNISTLFSDTSTLLTNAVKNKDTILRSDILATTLIYFVNDTFKGDDSLLVIPDNLKNAATETELTKYSSNSPWYTELNNLFNNVSILFKLGDTKETKDNKVNFDDPDITTKIMTLLSTNYDTFSSSQILMATVTSKVDEAISDSINEKVLKKAKINGIYDKNELKSILALLAKNGLSLENAGALGEKLKTGLTFLDIDETNDGSMYFNDDRIGYYLIRGFFTTAIEEMLNINPLCYDENFGLVLKKQEIVTLINLIKNNDGAIVLDENTYNKFTLLTIGQVQNLIGTDTCKSYLLVGLMSDALLGKDGAVFDLSSLQLPVPDTVVELTGYISYIEIRNLFIALKSLGNSDDKLLTELTIPSDYSNITLKADLMKSNIINAMFTSYILTSSPIEKTAVIKTKDQSGNPILLLSTTEINALINIGFPNNETSDTTKLYKSSIFRTTISDTLSSDSNVQSYIGIQDYNPDPNKVIIHTYLSDTYQIINSEIVSGQKLIFTEAELNYLYSKIENGGS